MAQTAPDQPPDVSSGEKSIADASQDMPSMMKGYRAILYGIQVNLDTENIINENGVQISSEEVKEYRSQVNTVLQYVINPDNQAMITKFVPTVQSFEEIARGIIRNFGNALYLWTQYINNANASVTKKDEAIEAYQKRLDECRAEVGKLVAAIKNV